MLSWQTVGYVPLYNRCGDGKQREYVDILGGGIHRHFRILIACRKLDGTQLHPSRRNLILCALSRKSYQHSLDHSPSILTIRSNLRLHRQRMLEALDGMFPQGKDLGWSQYKPSRSYQKGHLTRSSLHRSLWLQLHIIQYHGRGNN